MKSRKQEALFAKLDQLKSDPTSDESLADLKQILKRQSSVVVARAAQIIERSMIGVLLPDLIPTFDRFMSDPIKTDPSCLAKIAIAETLYRLEFNDPDVFLQGIRHTQMEPVYGGQMDTAPKLRVTCALGLVRMHYPRVFIELADLLADPETPVRMGAAQAVAYTGDRDRGVPLLRLRAQTESEPEVISECLRAIIQLDPYPSLAFVAQFLEADLLATQEFTALVLGESHLSEAFIILKQWWNRLTNRDLCQTATQAMAMLRTDEAFQFLLQLISEGSETDAQMAKAALDPYCLDADLQAQVIERLKLRSQKKKA